MPIFNSAPQGSDEWLRARLGCLTGSRMADAMAFLKNGKEAEARAKYKSELVAERIADYMVNHYVTPDMEWGSMQEPNARARFEEETGILVEPVGFVIHDTVEYWGVSPDGLIGDEGLVEFKAPRTTTFIKWLADGVVPEQHKPQMTAQLVVTGRRYCTFAAYDPRVRQRNIQMFIRQFEPTADERKAVEEAARQFLAEVDELFDRITRIPTNEKEIA